MLNDCQTIVERLLHGC